MRRTRTGARAGISLAEAVVALGVLALGMCSLLQLGAEEARRVSWTRERLVAAGELSRLCQAYANRPLRYFEDQGLDVADPAAFTPLHRSVLDSNPLLVGGVPPGVERFVLLEPRPPIGERPVAALTLLVRYRTPAGQTRELSAVRVVD